MQKEMARSHPGCVFNLEMEKICKQFGPFVCSGLGLQSPAMATAAVVNVGALLVPLIYHHVSLSLAKESRHVTPYAGLTRSIRLVRLNSYSRPGVLNDLTTHSQPSFPSFSLSDDDEKMIPKRLRHSHHDGKDAHYFQFTFLQLPRR